MNDDELKSTLAGWTAPQPPAGISERAWERFEQRRRPWWNRFFGWRLSVPLPAAAAAMALLIALGAGAGIVLRPQAPPRIVRTFPETVVREKVVTRTVYVRRPAAACAPERPRVAALTLAGFVPVSEIKPQIIRRN